MAYVIRDHAKFGKGFFASRNIKAGKIIHEEKPILVAPHQEHPHLIPCFSCGGLLSMNGFRPCAACGCPVCSWKCEKDALHANNECKLLRSRRLNFCRLLLFQLHSQTAVAMIMALRVVSVKESNPSLYQNILRLQSQFQLPPERTFLDVCAQEFLGKFDFQAEEIKRLMDVFAINCFMKLSKRRECLGILRRVGTLCLYTQACRINHSCVPNAQFLIDDPPGCTIRIFATTDIAEGEEIIVDYSNSVRCSTPSRQLSFQKRGHFICKCRRCLDPTELGTFMTGITCKDCLKKKKTNRYFLQVDPLDLSDNAEWKCNGCEVTKVGSEIVPPIEKLASKIYNDRDNYSNVISDEPLIRFCEDFINDNSGILVHPNHYMIREASKVIFKTISENLTAMDDRRCELCIKHGHYILAILDVVSPGCAKLRAKILEPLGRAYFHQARELKMKRNYAEAIVKTKMSLKLLKEANIFNQNVFPTNDPEKQFYNATRSVVEDVAERQLRKLRRLI